VILGNSYDLTLGQWRAEAHSLLSAQEFWFACFMTVLYAFLTLFGGYYSCFSSVLIPWFTLREVPVEVEIVGPFGFFVEIR
jgi:hypothetical protein